MDYFDAYVRDGDGSGMRHEGVPGHGHAFVAAFRSTVTDVLGERAGMRLAVIAATEDTERLRRRLAETWHAAWIAAPPPGPSPFQRAHVDPADVRYEMVSFESAGFEALRVPPGISLDAGRLRVALPPRSTAAELDQMLGIALDDIRFDALAPLPKAVRHRHAAGRAVDLGPRYARRLRGGSVTLVRNVYAFAPTDLPDLICAVALAREGLVARLRMAAAHHPPRQVTVDR